ncbi:MAG: hypothetical protein IJ205_00110 [Bacteroidales bacterium]|nr:hypothetical protein [Bacteroidales bacterium]
MKVVVHNLLLVISVAVAVSCGGTYPATEHQPKALFIGNSFIYYGGCVEFGKQGKVDKGLFDAICKANGFKIKVYDCTYGGHDLSDFTSNGCLNESRHKNGPYGGCIGIGKDLLDGLDLNSFDYVFISEAGKNNSHFLEDFRAVKERFRNPKTKFFYLSHSFTHMNNHRKIINVFPELEKEGVTIVEWGKLVNDLSKGRVAILGSVLKYDKNTFIKNKGDDFHENPLSGYITAQMAFCAMTGKSAIGQDYSFCDRIINFSKFKTDHYRIASDTNFDAIFASRHDMEEIQKLIDRYLQ